MGEKPYRYLDSLPSKLDDEDVNDQIRFQVSKNNIKNNHKVIIAGYGVGLSWGSALIKWEKIK